MKKLRVSSTRIGCNLRGLPLPVILIDYEDGTKKWCNEAKILGPSRLIFDGSGAHIETDAPLELA